MDTFRVLSGVHFMHTISRFEAWEVRSPTLQTGCKSKLKRRSYGLLKRTASSYAKISQLRNELRKFRRVFRSPPTPFRRCEMGCENVSTLKNGLRKCPLDAKLNHVAKSPPSYESSCKSSPS